MNNRERYLKIESLVWELGSEEALKRLAGVRGPELGLVGDVAERIAIKGTAEDGLPGERGVEEIVVAQELRGYIARQLNEARLVLEHDRANDDSFGEAWESGVIDELEKLTAWLDCRTSKRSDLLNAGHLAAARSGPNPT